MMTKPRAIVSAIGRFRFCYLCCAGDRRWLTNPSPSLSAMASGNDRELEAARKIAIYLGIQDHQVMEVNLAQWGGSSPNGT